MLRPGNVQSAHPSLFRGLIIFLKPALPSKHDFSVSATPVHESCSSELKIILRSANLHQPLNTVIGHPPADIVPIFTISSYEPRYCAAYAAGPRDRHLRGLRLNNSTGGVEGTNLSLEQKEVSIDNS